MSTAQIITLPSFLCFASVVMTISRVNGLSESPYNYEEQAFGWAGERWSAQLDVPNTLDAAKAAEIKAWGVRMKGRLNYVLFGDPSSKTPRGVATGAPQVKGSGQVGNTLLTDGWTINTAGIMKAGDYIQLGSDSSSRLHMVVEDANSDSGGNAALIIEPALRSSPLDNSAIIVNEAKGLFRLTSDDWSWSVGLKKVHRFSFSLIEVVNA